MPTGAGIERAIGAVRRAGTDRDVAPRAETGIGQTLAFEILQRQGVEGGAFGLEDDLPLPGQAQPEQILDDGRDEFAAGAAGIDILDPQQEMAAARLREIMRLQRGPAMAQVEPPGGAGREARHGLVHPPCTINGVP